MKIPFLSIFGKKEKPQYFLALLIGDEKASAVIFEELRGKVQIKGEAQEYFKTSVEETTDNEWLEVLDTAISNAEGRLPENIETKKTVFGLKENWVQGSKIKREYLLKLKKASDAMGLEPIGFLVIHEAITHFLGQEEGAPVSAIIVEVDKASLSVSICRAGKVIETKRAKIEENTAESCDRLLHHFTKAEILPSRIIIFAGQEAEKLQQEFISHTWSKSLSFLHVPQITSLPQGFDAKAVLFGAATQMGFEVLEEAATTEDTEGTKDNVEKQTPATTETQKLDKSEDISVSEEFSASVVAGFGFLKEEDVVKPHIEEQTLLLEKESPEEKIPEEKRVFKIPKAFRLPSFPSLGVGGKTIFIPSLILILIIAILGLYIFKLQAVVVLNLSPKIIEQNKDITFSTTQNSDLSKNIIHSETVSVSQDGEATSDVIGKKEVGEKAKGTVTIYSRLTDGKTFLPGTVIKANNLEFTLDKAATVSSSSADASANPTTVTVSVTAKDIGKESNLPSGTKFSVGSFETSDVIAKNDSAFSGGTKKEVIAVSKADQDKLLSDLPKKLEQSAKDALLKNVSSDKTVLPIFTNTTFTKKEFNQKIGDETSKLKLTATVTFQGMAYKKEDIDSFSKDLLMGDFENMTLAKSGIQYDLKDLKVKNSKEVFATFAIKSFLIPIINNQKVTDSISGKSFEEAKRQLLSLPQVSSVNITLSPNLPFLPKTLPRFPKNIKLSLSSQE